MVRVIHPREQKAHTGREPVNKAIDPRLVSLPFNQVYFVPEHRIVPAELSKSILVSYKDENLISRTRAWN